MKRRVRSASVLLLAAMLVSCGGSGDGGDGNNGGSTTISTNGPPSTPPPSGGTPTGGGSTPPPTTVSPTVPVTLRVEESDPAVTLNGAWTPATTRGGWSGGSAMEAAGLGATASFTFTGTSVRWIGRRSKEGAIARVSVDGRAPVEVDLYAEPNEIRTPIVTLYDLGEGPHTLTIEVTGTWNAKADTTQRIPFVTVDAFDVEPQLVSRFQEMDPDDGCVHLHRPRALDD